MKKLTILILAAAMFAGCVQEQKKETGKTEAEAPAKKQKDVDAQKQLKIAWVQLDSVQANYEYYKQVQDELEKKQANAEATITQKGKSFAAQYQSLQKRAQAGELNQEQYEKEALRLQQAQTNLENLQAKLSMQLQEDAMTRQKSLVDTVRAQVKKYAKEKGYDFVLCQNSDINNILYAADVYDVTEEIIAILNKHYKADSKKADKSEEKKGKESK